MDTITRRRHYTVRNGTDRLTPAQRRRLDHKDRSPRTHAHPEGTVCTRCAPAGPLRAWKDEANHFRPYNRSWLSSVPAAGHAHERQGQR